VLTIAPPASDADRIQAFKLHTEAKLEGVRCPRHNQAPRLKFNGSSMLELTISMSACCDRLSEIANKVIAS